MTADTLSPDQFYKIDAYWRATQSVARLHMLLRCQHRLMRTSPRPEAVAMVAEGRIDQRLQYLQERLQNAFQV